MSRHPNQQVKSMYKRTIGRTSEKPDPPKVLEAFEAEMARQKRELLEKRARRG